MQRGIIIVLGRIILLISLFFLCSAGTAFAVDVADHDGDGYSDKEEIENYTDPFDPKDYPFKEDLEEDLEESLGANSYDVDSSLPR